MSSLVLIAVLLSACAISHKIDPIDPPAQVEPAQQPGHFLAPIEPKLVVMREFGLCRYVEWLGLERFASFACYPSGLAKDGEGKKRCFLSYGGVKVDGSESVVLHMKRGYAEWWDYVYIPDEQWKIAWTDCGYPNVYDMGGTG
jgi:hypothetical protein